MENIERKHIGRQWEWGKNETTEREINERNHRRDDVWEQERKKIMRD